MTFTSFAQNYEDVMLWRVFKGVSKGFYIDVGAHHPKDGSVTHAFYESGWRGINVEPDNAYYEILSRERTRDINLECAVGATDGEVDFWRVGGGGLSTANKEEAEKRRKAGMSIWAGTVTCRTLKSICDEYVGDRSIHFLKVDVEGFEEQVLLGADFVGFRPWVVIVEATAPMSQVETHAKWEHLLLSTGYSLCYKDGLNRFYLAEEKSELASAFTYPPNYFDDFILFRETDSAELLRLRHEMDLILHSRSWRVTRPLRMVMDFFR